MEKESWYFKNKESVQAYHKEYRKNNTHIFKQRSEAYRARKLNAEPKWLTKEMKDKMVKIYKYCKLTSEYHGISYSVDHIVPLKGDNVCGMHVPWNLQIIKSSHNISKKNKVDAKIEFDGYIIMKDDFVKRDYNFCRKVVRLNDGKTFESVSLAAKDEGCMVGTISAVCNGNKLTIHRNFYRYYENVGNIEEEFEKAKDEYMNNKKTVKRVLCVTDKSIFNTLKDACEFYNIKYYDKLSRHCKNGKSLDGRVFKFIF